MMHFPHDELAEFRTSRERAAHDDAIAVHLAACSACRETLALFDEMEEAFSNPVVWEEVPKVAKPARGLKQLLGEKARIETENADALHRLASHLKSAMHFEDGAIAENPRFHDAGVVRMLTSRAAVLRDSQPKFALLVATAACDIARKLTADPEPSQKLLLACALRERANALRFVGRSKDALATLDEAEPLFRQLPDAAFELAIVDYVRGTALLEFDERYPEARDLAVRAMRVFRDHGDHYRELSARLLYAGAVAGLEGHTATAQAYERVISLALHLDECEIAGDAFHNAATEYAELRDFEKAAAYYSEALARHDLLGNAVGKANTEWELARLLVLRGELERGASALADARKRLLELGLRQAHALATLDWAEARLASRRPDGVAAACQEIMLRYESEGATRNARLALAYFHEALRQGKATPALVHDVRSYLAKLPRNPELRYQPVP
jgi:tetratricopeptide (TPR) repeat protein